MSATVIVPSRGPASRLERLLGSLAAQDAAHETIVVDNGSPGGEVSKLCDREEFAFASAVRLEENLGFSVPVNRAAERASGNVLVLVNDDCVCDPGFVGSISAGIDPGAGVLMAAGVMRDFGNPGLIDTAGMELDRTLLVYDYLNGSPVSALGSAPDPVGPSAAAAAFDAEAFRSAGGFDERLFAYWEDVDLVVRLRLEGATCVLARDAVGTHEHSATLGSGSRAKNELMGFGRGYVLRKWGVMSPGRAPAVIGRELTLVAGQAFLDRNVAGFRGRLSGWRAAGTAERHTYPEEVASLGGGAGFARTMRRRFKRRRRLGRRRDG